MTVQVAWLYCPASRKARGSPGSTHDLVPKPVPGVGCIRVGLKPHVLTCSMCGKTEPGLRYEAKLQEARMAG